MRSLLIKAVIILAACLLVAGAEESTHAFCFEEAAGEYGISMDLLKSIASHESGNKPDAIHYNENGSYDFGVMQINSNWYSTLGNDRWMALGDACYNVKVGAWIFSQCVRRFGYSWEAVGCYNAGIAAKNKGKRTAYAWKIYHALEKARQKKETTKSNITVAMWNFPRRMQ